MCMYMKVRKPIGHGIVVPTLSGYRGIAFLCNLLNCVYVFNCVFEMTRLLLLSVSGLFDTYIMHNGEF